MITVSDEWKKLHQQALLPETFVEIVLNVEDDISGEWDYIRYWNYSAFGNSTAIVHNSMLLSPKYYATLEENLWTLDGTRQILPNEEPYDNPGHVSHTNEFWSEETQSGIRIQIELKKVRETITPGLTITWSSEYDEYPTAFKIVAFNGETEVDTVTVTGNNSNISRVEHEFTGYDILRVIPLNWNMPNHRVRIDQIFFGQQVIFDKKDILSYSHEQTGDPLSSELSKNAIEFTIDNVDGRWDLLNPRGLTRHLVERQTLNVRYGVEINGVIEWISSGRFFLSEWKVASDGLSVTFNARDAIEFMLNTSYSRSSRKAVVNNNVISMPVYATKEKALEISEYFRITAGDELEIYERDYHYHLVLGEGDVPLNAVTNLLHTDLGWIYDGSIKITEDQTIYPDVVEALKKCNIPNLQWVYGSYFKEGTTPMHIEAMSVAEFIQICANKCGYAMWQSANGELKFIKPTTALTDYIIPLQWMYNFPEIELSKPLKRFCMVRHYNASVTSATDYPPLTPITEIDVNNEGETITVDNPYNWETIFPPLVADVNVTNAMKNAYLNWWKHRGWVSGEFRADPRLELFDVISVESKYGTISPVMITQIKYTYNGSFHGTYKGKILSTDFIETTDLDEVTEEAL